MNKRLKVDAALTPSCVHEGFLNQVCIVVDVLRASSTMVTLLAKGAPQVYTIKTIDEARSLGRSRDVLLGGERQGIPIPGFDFGNSPWEIRGLDLEQKSAAITTSNGTKAVELVSSAPYVLIGCFLNLTACCRKAIELADAAKTGIAVICAGKNGGFALDDAVCAGHLVETLRFWAETEKGHNRQTSLSDAAIAAGRLYKSYPNIITAFEESQSGQGLKKIGYAEDLVYCSHVDFEEVVPVLLQRTPCSFGNLM